MIWLLVLALLIVSGVALYELQRLERDYGHLDKKYISLLRLCRQKDQELAPLKENYRLLCKSAESLAWSVLQDESQYEEAVYKRRAAHALDAIDDQGQIGSPWDALAEVEACLRGDRDTELGIAA